MPVTLFMYLNCTVEEAQTAVSKGLQVDVLCAWVGGAMMAQSYQFDRFLHTAILFFVSFFQLQALQRNGKVQLLLQPAILYHIFRLLSSLAT